MFAAATAGLACGGRDEAPLTSNENLTPEELPIHMPPPAAAVFTQEIDHPRDGGPSLGTFKQRFWVSKQYARGGATAPVLFVFCGEAPCGPVYPQMVADSAKSLGATVVALEHRYYGESLPYPDLTLEHMKYLTIHNALEDAAAFQRWARDSLGLSGKWIAVGGSYSGMLAAFYREKHPELVVGAWASSAPVDMRLSFWGYDAIATRALGPTCALLFRQALAQIETAYDDPQLRQRLDPYGLFSLFPDKATLTNAMSGIGLSAAQYGTVRNVCAALDQHASSPAEGLIATLIPPLSPDEDLAQEPVDAGPGAADAGTDAAAVDAGVAVDAGAGVAVQLGGAGGNAVVLPSALIPRNRPPAATGLFEGAEWFYQTCTEVGFFQVHNPDRTMSIMSELVDEDYYLRQCDENVHTRPNVEKTRAEYLEPLLSGQVSNVLFVNGSLDPWSSLSFTDPHAAKGGLSTFVVQQGTHCEDQQNLMPTSLLGVFEAHKMFHDLAKTWLTH